jgi:hypothetical protein
MYRILNNIKLLIKHSIILLRNDFRIGLVICPRVAVLRNDIFINSP